MQWRHQDINLGKVKKQSKDNTDSRYTSYTEVSHLHFEKIFAKQGLQN